jgi:hypothetical protein
MVTAVAVAGARSAVDREMIMGARICARTTGLIIVLMISHATRCRWEEGVAGEDRGVIAGWIGDGPEVSSATRQFDNLVERRFCISLVSCAMIERFSWCSLGRATKYITLPISFINPLFLCFDVPA